jgi:uncharacterized protein YkwD
MANKIALLLLAGIVLTAVGAGAAIGLYLTGGGDGGTASPTPASGGGAATPTATAGNATGGGANATANGTTATPTGTGTTATPSAAPTATPTTAPTPTATATPDLPLTPTPPPTDSPTPTATGTPTATPTPQPVSPAGFNETRVEVLVREEINDRRAERGLDRLFVRDGMPEMAKNHSRRMADQGYPSHAAGGFSTRQRYERNGFGFCGIPDDTNTDSREGDAIETIDKVSAGQQFDGRYNRNEREIARDAVENWFADGEERTKLTYENAGSLGVGVVVSGSGHAYLTVDLCN